MEHENVKKIIVVDDQSIVARDIQATLQKLGYDVPDIAGSGEEAIEKVKLHGPDLVLMDIRIRGDIDGIETARQIREKNDIPVIFITAYSDKETLARAKLIGPYGYLLKPFEQKELKVAIEMALYKHELENALKESEEKFRMMAENSTDVLWAIDMDFKFTYISPSVENIRGFTQEEAMAQSLEDTLTEESLERGMAIIMEHLDKPKSEIPDSWTIELEQYKKDGSTIWTEATVKGVFNEDDELIGIQGLTRDINDRKIAEMELEEYKTNLEELVQERSSELAASEEKYRTLIERASDVIAILQDGKIVFINQQVRDMFGFDPDEMIDKDFAQFVDEDSRKYLVKMYKARIAGEEIPSIYEAAILNIEGKSIPVEINASLIQFKGKPADLVMIRDLSERRRAEEEIKTIKERFEYALGVSDTGFTIIDGDFNVEYVDPQWAQKLGDYEGKKCYDYFNQFDEICSECSGLPAIKNCEISIAERYLEKDNKYIEVHNVPLHEPGEKPRIAKFVRDITERKRAAEALAESEEMFRNLAEKSPNMIFINQGGRIVYVNPECKKLLGYTKEEFVDPEFDYINLISPKHREMVGQMWERHMAGEEVPGYEYALLTKDGRELYCINSTKIIKFMGKPAILGIVTDITERKKAEEAPLLTQFAIDRSSDAAFWLDIKGNFFYVNDAASETLGYTKNELRRMHMDEISLDKPTIDWNDLMDILRDRGSYTFESYLKKKDGDTFPVEINVNYLRYSDREIICAFARDITERKASEAKIRESEEQLKALFEASVDGIGVEMDGRQVYANPAMVGIFGYDSVDELIGMPISNLVHESDRERVARYAVDRMAGKSVPRNYEFLGLRKDGSTFDAEISVSRYEIEDKVYIVGFVRDITEEKLRQEEEMQRRVLQAQFDMKSVITDIVPVMLSSLEKEGREELIQTLSQRLDKLLDERYRKMKEPEEDENTALSYIDVLTDLGGEASCDCKGRPIGGNIHNVTVTKCPWDNQVAKNIALCILCRGIAWRFAFYAKDDLSVKLEQTMADGHPTCLVKIGEAETK